jgi:glycosyltransferase involved in cell wall biosynthesis
VKHNENGYVVGVTDVVRRWASAVVVVPAHNEAAQLPGCLRSVFAAALHVPIPTRVIVVLDACDDGSANLAAEFGADADFISVDARNVGVARAAGFAYARSIGGTPESRVWYATTDADSRVGPNWLLHQISVQADMVLGVVHVAEWRHYPPEVARRYLSGYSTDGPGHNHVHGANLGCRADMYWRIGGFAPLKTGEDVDLVKRFERDGGIIRRDSKLSVATSDRRTGRAPAGFADHISQLAALETSCRSGGRP